jgi:hypothetical protein
LFGRKPSPFLSSIGTQYTPGRLPTTLHNLP